MQIKFARYLDLYKFSLATEKGSNRSRSCEVTTGQAKIRSFIVVGVIKFDETGARRTRTVSFSSEFAND